MFVQIRDFGPAYWPDEHLDLDVCVEVTYSGRAPSRPSYDDPGDGGDPPEYNVFEVFYCGRTDAVRPRHLPRLPLADVSFLRGELLADPQGRLTVAVAWALAEEAFSPPHPDDYRPYDGPEV